MAVDPRRLAGRIVAGTLLSVAIYYGFWGGEYTAFDLGRLAMNRKEEAARLVVTRTEVDSLEALAEALENDPVVIERVARERFGMVREGEVLYRFVEAAPVAAQSATP